jgi:hypothetical protein
LLTRPRPSRQMANTAIDDYSTTRQGDDIGFRRKEPAELEDETHQVRVRVGVRWGSRQGGEGGGHQGA